METPEPHGRTDEERAAYWAQLERETGEAQARAQRDEALRHQRRAATKKMLGELVLFVMVLGLWFVVGTVGLVVAAKSPTMASLFAIFVVLCVIASRLKK